VRIPSWLGAAGVLHSEAVYIGADRFHHHTTLLAFRRRTIHIPQRTPHRHRYSQVILMSAFTVKDVARPLTTDIDSGSRYDVREADGIIFSSVTAAQDALKSSPPSGFSDFERDQLINVIGGFSQAHRSIRMLLGGSQGPWAVDALAIARLQLETLYNLCFLLQSPENIRLFMKASWKKKYTRFLLERAETIHLPRFADFTERTGPEMLENLRTACFVTEEERRTINDDELGAPFGPTAQRVEIPPFPTPAKVIKRLPDGAQRDLLKRLYFEYQFLCSFAHGDPEVSLFRAISDTRSVARHLMPPEKIQDFYQRQVLEPPIAYSALSSLQAATEIAALYAGDIELMVKVSQGWTMLLKYHQLAAPMWEIRSQALINTVAFSDLSDSQFRYTLSPTPNAGCTQKDEDEETFQEG